MLEIVAAFILTYMHQTNTLTKILSWLYSCSLLLQYLIDLKIVQSKLIDLYISPLINNLDSKCVFVSLYLIFVFLQDRKLQGLLVCVRVKYVLTKKFRLIQFSCNDQKSSVETPSDLTFLDSVSTYRSEPCNTLATVSLSSEPPSSYQPSLATLHPNWARPSCPP